MNLLTLIVAAGLFFSSPPASAANYSTVYSDGTPTVSSCGTSPSVAGKDAAGVITTGSGTVTSCTLNFSATLQAAPSCVVQTSATTVTPAVTSVSSTSVVIGLSSTLTSGKIYYHCFYVLTGYDPQIQWTAHMEGGNLTEWYGETNSGSAANTAVTAASQGITAHGGSYVMKQAVTGSSGAARIDAWPINALSQAGTTFYASWYAYFPSAITFGSSDQYQFWQIASYGTAPGAPSPDYAPMWGLYLDGTSSMIPKLVWSPNSAAPANGPHDGETGPRVYNTTFSIPTGQWVFIEIKCTPAGATATDFTGALKIWMNGTLLWDLTLIKTRYVDGSGSPTPGLMYTEFTSYGSNLTPTPGFHFVDDVTYSLGRLP